MQNKDYITLSLTASVSCLYHKRWLHRTHQFCSQFYNNFVQSRAQPLGRRGVRTPKNLDGPPQLLRSCRLQCTKLGIPSVFCWVQWLRPWNWGIWHFIPGWPNIAGHASPASPVALTPMY